MRHTPLEIKRLGTEGIQIAWSDGTIHNISSRCLRENCPAADSRARRGEDTHAAPLTTRKKSRLAVISATIDEEISLQKIWSIGTYAIGMEWKDGHSTGIYTYDLLFSLGEQEQQKKEE